MMFGQSYSSSSSGGRGGGGGLVNGKLASSCCIMLLLLFLLFVQRIDEVNALAPFLSKKTSTTRYFTHEGVLPPLHLSTPPSQQQQQPSNIINSTIIPYSSPASTTSCISEESVVPVTYTNDPKTVYQWFTKNLPHEGCILGVDVESVHPGFHSLQNHKGRGGNPFHSASTVQLATPNACLVVHLVRKSGGQFSYACAPILKAIFEDERYIKAGCALDGDFLSLHEIWGPSLQARSRLDLGLIGIPQQQQKQQHKTTTVSTGGGTTTSRNNRKRRNKGNQRTRHGLKSLCHCVLNIDLPKPKEVAVSDWSNVPLSDEQIIYSARDAWAGAMVGQRLADYDPDTFNVSSLMRILGEREPSISELAHRRKRRINAKRALARLLAPYQKKKKKTKTRHRQKHHHHQLDLPKTVHDKAQNLRVVIKQKISNNQLCFATDHLDIDL